ncbi:hypothetical protein KO500_11140 [Cellulophaga baltica]|uniref:hypothetical protein n=1 Tax=Cellulophaga TaxID=104264 RepID=UPI001C069301|nr:MULTISPECIES: hypothetical protein [Cellulophaga]MBU2996993.1 hypothetical protein [Cellulophaga baltica]MDO6768391.1 hypothetical protein [Cellulophaga sp. 1_MG-2023]
MKFSIKIVMVLFLLAFAACKNEPKKEKINESATPEIEKVAYDIPESWVNKRVEKAKARLNASEAGKVLWNGMEAQGGLKKWFNNGYLSFRFNYQPLDKDKIARDSYQTVDTWNNKARHNSIEDTTAIFGWDGKEAWIKADSTAFKYDTKFWALTPIYLFAHPFVLDGEGVNLELLDDKEYKGVMQDVIKVTFASGTGDAPDDYYVIYFDKSTHVMSAIRYIVSYPGYFPNGGHAPEKIMEIAAWETVDGIDFPTVLKTHWSKDGNLGEYITKIEVSQLSFSPNVPENYFSKPEGARVIE